MPPVLPPLPPLSSSPQPKLVLVLVLTLVLLLLGSWWWGWAGAGAAGMVLVLQCWWHMRSGLFWEELNHLHRQAQSAPES